MTESEKPKSRRWVPTELELAFHLYCQLPFGKLHNRNKDIIALAHILGRTPSSIALKLVNFSSLDPSITSTGRSGMKNASTADRQIWAEFNNDWEGMALKCATLYEHARTTHHLPAEETTPELSENQEALQNYQGASRMAMTEQRVKQNFFRRAVLSSYNEKCCITGISDTRLLVASHIVPWSKDTQNRLNPRNGLSLSCLHDKAFDRGLITISDQYEVTLSREIKCSKDEYIALSFHRFEGKPITLPQRFYPAQEFLEKHRVETFKG